jgi:hypothetical protein
MTDSSETKKDSRVKMIKRKIEKIERVIESFD